MIRYSRRTLGVMQAIGDVLCWFFATFALGLARYDFQFNAVQWKMVLTYTAVAAGLQLVGGTLLKLYSGRANVGTFVEVAWLANLVAIISLVVALVFLFAVPGFPRGIAVIVPFGAVTLMFAARFLSRVYLRGLNRRHQPTSGPGPERVLVYGAGNAGIQLERLLSNDPHAPYRVVGFIDDDPEKRNLHIGSSRVVGSGADLLQQARERRVDKVVLAVTTATPAFKTQLADRLEAAGLDLLILPHTRDIVTGKRIISQPAEFDVADLLGRAPSRIDLGGIASYLSGKVVLVTGAGGSIGSEIARQVHKFGPAELVCLDRDESGLHSVQLSIYGRGLLDTPDMVLCDIRDKEALSRVFAEHKPDVVFHAAALKHLPLLQQYPEEGWKTNVIGSLNVLECAREHGVQRFVNVSTDKAADPTSVLGVTKRRAEEMTSWFAENGAGSYVSVRFGNVLGSRGSVLFTFSEQIRRGGPVTVVHPEITRYFMTIPEACQLVIQAGAVGSPGDVMVLDMGEPVHILDVAKRLVRRSGKQIDIVFTGLRPGEKMHEVLFSDREQPTPLDHPLISRVEVPAVSPAEVLQAGLAGSLDRAGASEAVEEATDEAHREMARAAR